MKNKNLIIAICCMILMNISCRKALKDMNDYFPKVKTVSAVVQPDGSVIVTGEIEDDGYTTVQYAGVCMNTTPTPQLLDNQIISDLTSHTFTVTYYDFDPDSTYYFRTWAANDNGYAYGTIVRLDSIFPSPVNAPCTPDSNSVNTGGGSGTFSYYSIINYVSFSELELTCNTVSGPTVHFHFAKSNLTTGIYTITGTPSPGDNDLGVSFQDGAISPSLHDSSQVYVNAVGNKLYEITICDAPYTAFSHVFYFNTRFQIQL